jgi:hypothetical protein
VVIGLTKSRHCSSTGDGGSVGKEKGSFPRHIGSTEARDAAMSVLLFYALIILAGGLEATVVVNAPYAALRWTLSAYLPGWIVVILAFALSVGTLKLVNRALPGFLLLTLFMLVTTAMYHFAQAWRVLGGAGRAILLATATGLMLFLFAGVRRSGPMWPLALITRLAAILA